MTVTSLDPFTKPYFKTENQFHYDIVFFLDSGPPSLAVGAVPRRRTVGEGSRLRSHGRPRVS